MVWTLHRVPVFRLGARSRWPPGPQNGHLNSLNMKPFADLLEHFPRSRYHTDWHLMAWHPEGVLDDAYADRVVEFLEAEEAKVVTPFDRYTDMTGFTRIQLSLDHVFTLSKRRTRGYKGKPVKSAFFAIRLISLSIAHMYRELMEGSAIEVCVFRDREAAADWLGVPVQILQRPEFA
jgi:hypothetical protein